MKRQPVIFFAALLLLIGVGAGAFGAHGLKQTVAADMLATWHTAVLYQLIHGLGMLITFQLYQTLNIALLRRACYVMLTGTLIFSGSLYVLVLSGITWLGAITPIGGVLFLISWAMVAIAAWSGRPSEQGSR